MIAALQSSLSAKDMELEVNIQQQQHCLYFYNTEKRPL